MKLYQLNEKPDAPLSKALQTFEREFQYPLGENATFTISHGDDYANFYRSMGEATCFLLKKREEIIGSFCYALRSMVKKENNRKKRIAYLGDLKILPSYKNTRAYYLLAKNMLSILSGKVDSAIGVVMKGTQKVPTQYTGKLNIPYFNPIEEISILQIKTEKQYPAHPVETTTAEDFLIAYTNNCSQDYFLPSDPDARSALQPQWLVTGDQSACGLLEDTLHAKRLFDQNLNEIVSAHLSYFSFKEHTAAITLIKHALSISYSNHYPNLFLALNYDDFKRLQPHLSELHYTVSKATIFGAGAINNLRLNINTSEI